MSEIQRYQVNELQMDDIVCKESDVEKLESTRKDGIKLIEDMKDSLVVLKGYFDNSMSKFLNKKVDEEISRAEKTIDGE